MTEVIGNGPNMVTMQYWGGWGYKKYCTETAETMNKEFGAEAFTFSLSKDDGRTGNFEVVVNGTAVHSK